MLKSMRFAVAERIAQSLEELGRFELSFVSAEIFFSKEGDFRDLCDLFTPLPFKLSRTLNLSPLEVAVFIQQRIASDLFERVEAASPGYLNFFLRDRFLFEQLGSEPALPEESPLCPPFWEEDVGPETLENPRFALRHARDQILCFRRMAKEKGLRTSRVLDRTLCPEERRLLLALIRCSEESAHLEARARELSEAYRDFHRECRILSGGKMAGVRLALAYGMETMLSDSICRLDRSQAARV